MSDPIIKKSLRAEIIELLTNAGPMTSGELYEHSEIAVEQQQIYNAVHDLKKSGQVEKQQDGKFCVVDASVRKRPVATPVEAADTPPAGYDYSRRAVAVSAAALSNDDKNTLLAAMTKPQPLQAAVIVQPAFRCAVTSDGCLLLQGIAINTDGFTELSQEQTRTLFNYLDRALESERPA